MIHQHQILPVTQVKRELMKLLKTLQNRGGAIAITKDGRAAGVLMSSEDYEGMIETLEILQDRPLVRSLNRALKQTREGKTYSHHDVFGA